MSEQPLILIKGERIPSHCPPRVYLSPAAHLHPPRCACPGCSENAHANRYLDELTRYLTACGICWQRADPAARGAEAVRRAVAESNAFAADLHYAVHTVADGGQGTCPVVRAEDRVLAEVLLRERRRVYPGDARIFICDGLYEGVHTHAPCLYDRLVHHEDRADARFLHEHFRELAAATAKSFCALFGLPFREPE